MLIYCSKTCCYCLVNCCKNIVFPFDWIDQLSSSHSIYVRGLSHWRLYSSLGTTKVMPNWNLCNKKNIFFFSQNLLKLIDWLIRIRTYELMVLKMFVVERLIVYKSNYIFKIPHMNDSDYQTKLCSKIMNQHLQAGNHVVIETLIIEFVVPFNFN